jgi:hypothetical protein
VFISLEEEADEATMMENGRRNVEGMEDRKKQKTRLRKEDHAILMSLDLAPPPTPCYL